MYQISVNHTTTVKLDAGKEVNLTDAIALSAEAKANRAQVIEGASTVEKQLVTIIAHYFRPERDGKWEELKSAVLDTDFCSFSVKRKLVEWIVGKDSLLEGKERAEYFKSLIDTMRFRNAFTHGTFISNGEKVSIHYYEGGQRVVELTDPYLHDVEVALSNAYHVSNKVAMKSGATKEEGKRAPDGEGVKA